MCDLKAPVREGQSIHLGNTTPLLRGTHLTLLGVWLLPALALSLVSGCPSAVPGLDPPSLPLEGTGT